jgi:hypothetical protein
LWAICPFCARWNLSPLEERWEALEECERLFRETRLRTSTDEIGMARLAEGLELVRIGRPLRPEFAAWRFGDQLGLRRRRALRSAGATTLLAGGAAAAGVALVGTAVAGPLLVFGGGFLATWISVWRETMSILTVSGGDGRRFALTGEHTKETTLTPEPSGEGWSLHLQHARGLTPLEGYPARRILSSLLTRVNAKGAGTGRIRQATALIEEMKGPEGYLRFLARESQNRSGDYRYWRAEYRRTGVPTVGNFAPRDAGALPRFSPEMRLALEMCINEETERRALADELTLLHTAWREAEEIARIADRLAGPAPATDG